MNAIKKLIGKNKLLFTERCNKSIRYSLKAAKKYFSEKNIIPKLLIQDQGGWMTYSQIAKKEKLSSIYLPTNKGKLILGELDKYKDSILLIHSRPGYCYEENMDKIQKICKARNIFLINDCCGSIGKKQAKLGDVIVCSFGKYKPISIGKGGFIAFDRRLETYVIPFVEEFEVDKNELNEQIKNLDRKLNFWNELKEKTEKDIKEQSLGEVVNEKKGINILIKPSSTERLIKYCKENNLYYTRCPRYIRSNMNGLCIEIKRKGDIHGM